MGTVTAIRTAGDTITLARACTSYLTTLDRPETRGTHQQYAATLRRLREHFGPAADITGLPAEAVRAWIEDTWGSRQPATYNRALGVFRSAWHHWAGQGWVTEDPTAPLRRRKVAPDRSRALPREAVERLLTRESIPLRERTLWRLAYESAARASELLRLDIADLDLPNRRARVRRKGGAIDMITWQTGTARLLPRLLAGRKDGPVFVTDRKACVPLPPADLDPATGRARLSYRQAAGIFDEATAGEPDGPWTLHQLRHSALTHAAEAGASTAVLLAYGGHTSTRSLAKYTRLSADALARWQADRDTARRR